MKSLNNSIMNGLKNDFPPAVKRFWFLEHPYCYSGLNGPCDLHHIRKRINNSIFNSIPLNRREHDGGEKHYTENEYRYLRWTFIYVSDKIKSFHGIYSLRPVDIEFLGQLVAEGIVSQYEYKQLCESIKI